MVGYINKGENLETKPIDLSNKKSAWIIVVNYPMEFYLILAT